MKSMRNRSELVKRFCDLLGRQNSASGFLDRIARWVVPLPPAMDLAAAGPMPAPLRRNRDEELRKLIHGPMLAQGPMLQATNRGDAPDTPHDASEGHATVTINTATWWDRLWGGVDTVRTESGTELCAPDRYHGMHGTPCLYAGGSDTKCPKGTVSGWFWSYKTKAGVFYYVDCCGGTQKSDVWCGWTSEDNWCGPWGRTTNTGGSTKYNCTLAMPSSLMMTKGLSSTQFEVVGVDP
jgi:hypothetical protein